MDWDERFLRGDELHGYVPSPPLPQAIEGVAPGRALDLACGAGRHALFLAERGWTVHAIDGSQGRRAADARRGYKRASLAGSWRGRGHRVAPLPHRGRARPGVRLLLFCTGRCRTVRRAVRPGGLFRRRHHVQTAPTRKAGSCSEPGELRALFADWEIVHSRGAAGESEHRHASRS